MTQLLPIARLGGLLALAGGWAIALSSSVSAQQVEVPITGGTATFNDTQIFVPNNADIDGRTIVFEGGVPDSFLIRTNLQGNNFVNAVIRGSTLPVLSTGPCCTPGVGDTGEMLGTLSFRGFSASGEPALFTNIPVSLQFQINAITLDPQTAPFVQFQTQPTTLSETGTVETDSTFEVRRDTPVIYVQFQPEGTPAQDTDLLPATAFDTEIPGLSYSGDFSTDLTGGSITVPNPPGISLGSNVAGGTDTPTPPFGTPGTIYIIDFFGSDDDDGDGEDDADDTLPGLIGDIQDLPILPGTVVVGVFVFESVPSGAWVDPPMQVSQTQRTFGFDFTMTPRPVPVGIASRVFPGMVGVGRDSSATFTAITGFPDGIDADDRYTVSVDGIVLGQFGPGDTLRFSDYQSVLGDRLIDGVGVTSFQVSGIEPGVDPSDPTAFPIRLEYSTSTASFEMRSTTPTNTTGNAGENVSVNPAVRTEGTGAIAAQ